MRVRIKQGVQTLRRAHRFLAGGSFECAVGELAPQVELLGEFVRELEQHVTEAGHRSLEARVATVDKRSRGDVLLREYLRPIAKLARLLFVHDATARAGFSLPRRRDAEGLLQLAEGFTEQCAQHEARLVAGGLAPDFLQRVRGATVDYRAAINTRGRVVGRRVAATAGMEQLERKGREQVRLIDTMLVPRLARQPDVLAEWRSIARFVRRSGPGAASGEVEAPDGTGTTGGTGTSGTPGAPGALGDGGGATTALVSLRAATPAADGTPEVRAAA